MFPRERNRKELIKMKKDFVKIWKEHSVVEATVLTVCMITGHLVGVFGGMCLRAWLIMLLWNWVAVSLFNAPVLTFWTAFGLDWLCALLLRSRPISKKSEK
jgi:hypothetical protein